MTGARALEKALGTSGGLLVVAFLCLGAPGCGGPPKGTANGGARWYHAHLVSREGDPIPFFLQLPGDCAREAAVILNGEQRVRADCHRSPSGFLIDFPVYGTQIDTRFEPDGSLSGRWSRELPAGRQRLLLFQAAPLASEPDPRTRFTTEPEGAGAGPGGASLAGTWRMAFELHGRGRATFSEGPSGVVRGSVEIESEFGDLGFLAGNVWGDQFRLSSFDGRVAHLLEGELKPDGTIAGDWIGLRSWDPFTAEPVEGFALADPLDRVRTAPGEKALSDLEPLADASYAGKAVIVEIFGTWCPNCNDLAPVLVEIYRQYHGAGLEILGLAYEQSDDRKYKERRVRAFKSRHGIEWNVVIADWTLEELACGGLDGLSSITAVPVTVFLNRDGRVHAVYSGFSGPATGDVYEESVAELHRLTREILGKSSATSSNPLLAN